jgi:hypothetical protein
VCSVPLRYVEDAETGLPQRSRRSTALSSDQSADRFDAAISARPPRILIPIVLRPTTPKEKRTSRAAVAKRQQRHDAGHRADGQSAALRHQSSSFRPCPSRSPS